jgi:hypothetical protein
VVESTWRDCISEGKGLPLDRAAVHEEDGEGPVC